MWDFLTSEYVNFLASVAQLVEHHLAKVDVESSNLFARSIYKPLVHAKGFFVHF